MSLLELTNSNASKVIYSLAYLDFGIVYVNSTGQDDSEYFFKLSEGYPTSSFDGATFDTTFQGIGLPYSYWNQVATLLQYVTPFSYSDSDTPDQGFTLPNTCASYDSLLGQYSFKVKFLEFGMEPHTTFNYMRVPLMTFAVDAANGECNLLVQSLSVGNNMILGGMFFTEFYGEF